LNHPWEFWQNFRKEKGSYMDKSFITAEILTCWEGRIDEEVHH
jgi:hypothetical protein